MKNLKKVLAVVLVLSMVIALAACGKTPGTSTPNKPTQGGSQPTEKKTYDIKVWVPEAAVELTQKQIKAYNETNTDGVTFVATVEKVSEADAATTMITDVESGADIYFFAQDQAARLIQANALSKLGVGAQKTITEANAAGVVAACLSGGEMYAYPLTSDNGYFMYYDKRVVADADVDDLTKIIADCEAKGKTFCFEMGTSAWYLASFFFAEGINCHSDWTMSDDGKNFTGVDDNFNSEKGIIAARGIYELVSSSAFVSSSKGTEFDASVPAGVVVSGTWDFDTVKGILGDNLGTADLPSFTVDGKSYHLGSYNGCKLLGVKPQKDNEKASYLHKLAQYLVSEEGQLERFNALAWGPANTNAQNNDAVKANPGLKALNQQAPYSIPQGQIAGFWWDVAKVIGDDVKESGGDVAKIKEALVKYEKSLAANLNLPEDEKEAWGVIGAYGTNNWNADDAMVKSNQVTDLPTYYSENAIFFKAGDEFKVRKGKSWDVNVGGDGALGGANFKVETEGYYFVKFVFNEAGTSELTLVKNSPVSGWTVIGQYGTNSWNADDEMEIQADGKTYKSAPIAFEAGNEFKVRLGHNWDTSFGNGGENFKVETAGTYVVVFDTTTNTIILEK